MNVQPPNVLPVQPTLAQVLHTLADAKDGQHLRYTQAEGIHVRSGFKMTEVLADLKVSSAVQARNHERQAAVVQFTAMINSEFGASIADQVLQTFTGTSAITVAEANAIIGDATLKSLFA